MGCGASSSSRAVVPDTLPPVLEEDSTSDSPEETTSKKVKKITKMASPSKQRSKSQERSSTQEEVDFALSSRGPPAAAGNDSKSEPKKFRMPRRKDTPTVLPSLDLETITTLIPGSNVSATQATSSAVSGSGPSHKVPFDKPPASSMLDPSRKIEGTESQIEFFRKLDEKIEKGPDYVPPSSKKLNSKLGGITSSTTNRTDKLTVLQEHSDSPKSSSQDIAVKKQQEKKIKK